MSAFYFAVYGLIVPAVCNNLVLQVFGLWWTSLGRDRPVDRDGVGVLQLVISSFRFLLIHWFPKQPMVSISWEPK